MNRYFMKNLLPIKYDHWRTLFQLKQFFVNLNWKIRFLKAFGVPDFFCADKSFLYANFIFRFCCFWFILSIKWFCFLTRRNIFKVFRYLPAKRKSFWHNIDYIHKVRFALFSSFWYLAFGIKTLNINLTCTSEAIDIDRLRNIVVMLNEHFEEKKMTDLKQLHDKQFPTVEFSK